MSTKDSPEFHEMFDSVMINGRLVMEDRQIGTIDAAAVRKKAREYADRIRKSLAVQ